MLDAGHPCSVIALIVLWAKRLQAEPWSLELLRDFEVRAAQTASPSTQSRRTGAATPKVWLPRRLSRLENGARRMRGLVLA